MSDLIPAPRSRPPAAPDVARTLETLATLVILILTVGILYIAREILVPIAIAILLSFVLSPLVKLLRHINVGKALSVGIVVVSAFLISIGIGVVIAKQISDLAADIPKYQETVTHKVDGLRQFIVENPLLTRINATLSDVSKMPAPPQTTPARPDVKAASADAALANATPGRPIPVSIIEPAPGIIDLLQKIAGTAASPIATAAFVAIFIVFMLMQREDLRNRFIRLVGSRDLQRTTLAMNDAARRLSRYFLAQMLLNTAFGIVVAIALTILGVPSAVLWGSVAIIMRFIPYIGSLGAALFPVLLAAAADPGWGMAIETALLFVVIETIVGQAIEPMVYGHNTGISPIAVVLSATFWTWLWGPVGLVLSTPLTVCLVVIGRHVERLSFLNIILGDAPALTPVEIFYQRILAGDISEIADHADQFLKDHTLTEYCDQVALQALLLAQRDVRRGQLDNDRLTFIKNTIDVLMEDLFDREADRQEPRFAAKPHQEPIASLTQDGSSDRIRLDEPAAESPVDAAWQVDGAVLCVTGRTPLDEAAAHILADLLRKHGIGAHVEPATDLSTNATPTHDGSGAKLIILSFLDADLSIAQARYTVRRLRRRIPNVPVVAAFWMEQDEGSRAIGLCGDVKSDTCVCNLRDALALCVDRARSRDVELAA